MSDRIPISEKLALELWREALRQEIGIRFPFNLEDKTPLLDLFYSVRKSAPDAETLQQLMICIGPGSKEIWIVKKMQEAP